MTLLEWRDGFRVGIDEVDHEHRALIDLINAAHDPGARGEALEAALGEIHALITAHFALEEKDMRERRYPALPDHKADHERLLDDIRDIMDDAMGAPGPMDAELGTRLAEWFSVHFRTHDAALHGYLAAHGAEAPLRDRRG